MGLSTLASPAGSDGNVLAWAKAKNLSPIGAPQLARYDPPWTLPMWRRNEIMLELPAP